MDKLKEVGYLIKNYTISLFKKYGVELSMECWR